MRLRVLFVLLVRLRELFIVLVRLWALFLMLVRLRVLFLMLVRLNVLFLLLFAVWCRFYPAFTHSRKCAKMAPLGLEATTSAPPAHTITQLTERADGFPQMLMEFLGNPCVSAMAPFC